MRTLLSNLILFMCRSCVGLFLILGVSNAVASQLMADLPKSTQVKYLISSATAVSCDHLSTNCIAIGIEPNTLALIAYVTHDGGVNWDNSTRIAPLTSEHITIEKYTSATIHCDESAMNCIVAQLGFVDKIPRPIIYITHDGGQSWLEPTILTVPLSLKERKILTNADNELMDSNVKLSCGLFGSNCTLVGSIYSQKAMFPFIYSTQNFGQNWVLATSLKEPYHSAPSNGFHGTFLTDLSCDQTGKKCKTVGYVMARNSISNQFYSALPVVYTSIDGGRQWSDPVILPTKMDFNHVDELTAISCGTSGKSCTTIGFTYHRDTNRSQLYAFTTQDSGRTWNKKVLIPSKELGELSSALTCDDEANRCIAIGNYYEYKSGFYVYKPTYYISSNDNKSWEKFDNNFVKPTLFNDIACDPYLTSCVVVGSNFTNNLSKTMLVMSIRPNLNVMNHFLPSRFH